MAVGLDFRSMRAPGERGRRCVGETDDRGKRSGIAGRLMIGLVLASVAGLPLSAWTALSVAVSNSTFMFGAAPANTWSAPQMTIIKNDGTETESLAGRISQLTAGSATWAISDVANGADSIRAQWSTTSDSGPWTDISAYDTDFEIVADLADGDSLAFWLRIQTPTTTSSYGEYSATLTVTAAL